MKIELRGKLKNYVSAKDVILNVISKMELQQVPDMNRVSWDYCQKYVHGRENDTM